MSDLNQRIFEKLTEVSERCARIEVELGSVKEDIRDIKIEDSKQNKLLAEHIAGTITNRERLELEIKNREDALKHSAAEIDRLEDTSSKRYKILLERLKRVEFLPNLVLNLKTVLLWIGGLAAAGIAIAKFLKLL